MSNLHEFTKISIKLCYCMSYENFFRCFGWSVVDGARRANMFIIMLNIPLRQRLIESIKITNMRALLKILLFCLSCVACAWDRLSVNILFLVWHNSIICNPSRRHGFSFNAAYLVSHLSCKRAILYFNLLHFKFHLLHPNRSLKTRHTEKESTCNFCNKKIVCKRSAWVRFGFHCNAW